MAYYALIPAAGAGLRMANATPKQYVPLAGHPVIWHALRALCAHPAVERVFVVISADDKYWADEAMKSLGGRVHVLRCGGETRAQSVLNGLQEMGKLLSAEASENMTAHWVLVHDAARPCLTASLIDALITEVGDDPVGGILAVPVADTLKRARPLPKVVTEGARIAATVSREGLWQAQTPQMFRYGLLLDALSTIFSASAASAANDKAKQSVTDEASALELLGYAPRLVTSSTHNLKVTYPADLLLAASILRSGNDF